MNGATMARRIRILLADDHEMVREGLRALLEREPDLEVVGDVAGGHPAVERAAELRPHVVVMDLAMGDLNGIEATKQILERAPSVRVLALSMHRERKFVRAMLAAGASGYMAKSSAARDLVDAVRLVAAGETYLSPTIAAEMVRELMHAEGEPLGGSRVQLTKREREVLALVAQGQDTKEIAATLQLSPKTVLAHRESLMRKVGVSSVVALARFALSEGLGEL
jgi:DNA-binding NarL/FixJ family response regulator